MRYSSIERFRFAASIDNETQVQVANNVASALQAATCQGKFVFAENEDLQKVLGAKGSKIEISVASLPSGKKINRSIVEVGGKRYIVRLFGNEDKELLAPQTIDGEKAKYGFCSSDGEIVADIMEYGGQTVAVNRIYANIEGLI